MPRKQLQQEPIEALVMHSHSTAVLYVRIGFGSKKNDFALTFEVSVVICVFASPFTPKSAVESIQKGRFTNGHSKTFLGILLAYVLV